MLGIQRATPAPAPQRLGWAGRCRAAPAHIRWPNSGSLGFARWRSPQASAARQSAPPCGAGAAPSEPVISVSCKVLQPATVAASTSARTMARRDAGFTERTEQVMACWVGPDAGSLDSFVEPIGSQLEQEHLKARLIKKSSTSSRVEQGMTHAPMCLVSRSGRSLRSFRGWRVNVAQALARQPPALAGALPRDAATRPRAVTPPPPAPPGRHARPWQRST